MLRNPLRTTYLKVSLVVIIAAVHDTYQTNLDSQ